MNTLLTFLIVIVVSFFLENRISRGYFWKDREGKELSFKEFLIRWKNGVVNITPLQQTKTSLWSMLPIFFGMLWGITVTFIGGVYWMTLILTFSLPLMFINFIGMYQRYKSQKAAYDAYNEAIKNTRSKK